MTARFKNHGCGPLECTHAFSVFEWVSSQVQKACQSGGLYIDLKLLVGENLGVTEVSFFNSDWAQESDELFPPTTSLKVIPNSSSLSFLICSEVWAFPKFGRWYKDKTWPLGKSITFRRPSVTDAGGIKKKGSDILECIWAAVGWKKSTWWSLKRSHWSRGPFI